MMGGEMNYFANTDSLGNNHEWTLKLLEVDGELSNGRLPGTYRSILSSLQVEQTLQASRYKSARSNF